MCDNAASSYLKSVEVVNQESPPKEQPKEPPPTEPKKAPGEKFTEATPLKKSADPQDPKRP